MFDPIRQKWINQTLDNLVFVGATADSNGVNGLVPSPKKGQQNYFLRADGEWAPAGSGSGSTAQLFEITISAGEDHQEAISNFVKDKVVNISDIAIVKELLLDETYTQSAYIFNGESWLPLQGNYSADNIYFRSNFVFTENVGTVKVPANGNIEVEAKGKSVTEFLSNIFGQQKNPIITQPSIELITNENTYQEVGSIVNPTYEIKFDSGKYSYGPETGVTVLSYVVSDSQGHIANTSSGTFEAVQVVDDVMDYIINATVVYSNGECPLDNLGNIYQAGQIKSNELSASSSNITGYRSYFYGMDNSLSEINSTLIRGLTNGGRYSNEVDITFKASELANVKRFIIAVPANSERPGLISAIISSSMNADALGDYELMEQLIPVEGVNGYEPVDYKVWVYSPAYISENEIHKIKLG